MREMEAERLAKLADVGDDDDDNDVEVKSEVLLRNRMRVLQIFDCEAGSKKLEKYVSKLYERT